MVSSNSVIEWMKLVGLGILAIVLFTVFIVLWPFLKIISFMLKGIVLGLILVGFVVCCIYTAMNHRN